MIPSGRCIWRTGNFSKMGIISIPSTILHRHFLLLPIRERYEDRRTKTVPSSTSNLWMPHQHRDPLGKQLGNPMRLLGSSREPRVLQPSGKIRRHHRLLPKRRCNFIQSKQLSPFPERLNLPYPDGEILSGFEEDVSFIRDRFKRG